MTSGSALVSRAMIKLFSGCPGAMGEPLRRVAFASASISRRSPAFRFFSSGPWQTKQFADRIGKTSRPKRTGSAAEKTTEAIEATGGARSSDILSQRWRNADRLDFISQPTPKQGKPDRLSVVLLWLSRPSIVSQRDHRVYFSCSPRRHEAGQQGNQQQHQRGHKKCRGVSGRHAKHNPANTRVSAKAATKPITTPVALNINPCPMTNLTRSRGCAPKAMRMPNSRALWVTV